MSTVQPALVVILDSKGELDQWLLSEQLRQVTAKALPVPILYIGKATNSEPIWRETLDSKASGREGLDLNWDDIKRVFLSQMSELRNAERLHHLSQQGARIADRTFVLILGNTGDPLVVNNFVALVKYLRRLVARNFPQELFHFSGLLLLPNMFRNPKPEDFARNYVLLRRIDGYQEDPPPFVIEGRPTRLFDSIWLANSSNEQGRAVGQFPEAGHALTTFFDSFLSGAVAFNSTAAQIRLEDRRPNYGSFGCSTLHLDKKYLQDFLHVRLSSDLLPRAFLSKPSSRESVVLETQKVVKASGLPNAHSQLMGMEGGISLWSGLKIDVTREKALGGEALLSELRSQRDEFLAKTLPETRIELERRRGTLQKQFTSEISSSATRFADERGAANGLEFLFVLVEDPPLEVDPLEEPENASLFGVLGSAVSAADTFIGDASQNGVIAVAAKKVQECRGQVLEFNRKLDVLKEQVASYEVRRPEPDLSEEARAEQLERQQDLIREQLETKQKLAEAEQFLQDARAEYRGLLISLRHFDLRDRTNAVEERRSQYKEQLAEAEKRYLNVLNAYRDQEMESSDLYQKRREWINRRIFTIPIISMALLIVIQLLLGAIAGWTELLRLWEENGVQIVAFGLVLILVYVAVCTMQYYSGLARLISSAEKSLADLGERAQTEARKCVQRAEEALRFEFELQGLETTIRLLHGVRESGRSQYRSTYELFEHIQLQSEQPLPKSPENSLYRSSLWDTDSLVRIYKSFVGTGDVVERFWNETGKPSTWIVRTALEFDQELAKFSAKFFGALDGLTLEDFIFHPRYAPMSAADRLMAFYDSSSPYLKLKHDLVVSYSQTNDVLFVKNGNASRSVEELRQRGLAPRGIDSEDREKMTMVRIRTGLPAYFLAEIDTYWNDYLRVSDNGIHPDPFERKFREVLPESLMIDFERVAEDFIILWFAGEITLTSEGYRLKGWDGKLGKSRRLIYAELIDCTPDREQLLDMLRARASAIRPRLEVQAEDIQKFIDSKSLEPAEASILSRFSTRTRVVL
jgi:hypothetical protein